MADQFDLSGMTAQEARSYVLDYLKALQEVRRQKKAKQDEFADWERRARLAKENDRADLQSEALGRCRELADEFESLSEQEQSLQRDVDGLKRKLATHVETSVNTNALLQNLENVVGDTHETDRAVDDLEVEDELADLKRQVTEEGDSSSDDDGNDSTTHEDAT
jgi:hypothetical protein